jgi:alkyldihydroxyacetonephosphate synthase
MVKSTPDLVSGADRQRRTARPSRDWGSFKAIAVDVDGTLAGRDGAVSPRTVAALARAERAGLQVVIVTGRAYPTVLAVWREAQLSAPLITCGGALTLQPPGLEVVAAHAFPTAAVGRALAIGRRHGLVVSLWTAERIWVSEPGSIADLLRRINVTASADLSVVTLNQSEEQRLSQGVVPVLKVMLGGPPSVIDRLAPRLLDELPGATAARSMPEFVEATAPEAGKAGALQVVLDRLGLTPEQVIVAGDGDNDIGMLNLAGLAVAPADARPGPLAVADLVVGAHDREGLAEFLEDLVRRRTGGGPSIAVAIEALLGAERVSAAPDDLFAHSFDAWPVAAKWRQRGKRPYQPEAVVRPITAAQVARLLRWANRERVPVSPWGLGSSVTGAPLPTRGGIVLDMSAMTEVLLLDDADLLVRVQAGKLGLELETELQARGFTLGHSPQSLDRSSVGGWVASRGTGQFSSRYGSIEDLVVALSVVLPTGELMKTPMVPRAAMGPDLRHLFIGGEGTTGVVVDVTLKIFPVPESRHLETVRFDSVAAGVNAMRLIARAGLRPFLIRFYDQDETPHAVQDAAFQGCAMFLGTEGLQVVSAVEHAAALEICRSQGGEPVGAAAAAAWMARRFDFSAVEKVLATPGGVAETIEIAQFWDRILDTYTAMKGALTPYATEVLGHFSHMYPQGSSLYLILLGQVEDDQRAEQRLREIWEVAMTTALSQGAALSHHHGVGLARLPYLRAALGSGALALERITEALDPNGIMNPGKLGHSGSRGLVGPEQVEEVG